MNPNRDEDETRVQARTRRKKKKLKIAEAPAFSRAQICDIIDHYDFEALHDRIMKAVDKFKS